MTGPMLMVFGILGGAIVLFAWGRPRVDIVAILVVLALMLSRVLTPHEALAGFGDPVVVLIAAIFIVGEALVNTGVVHRLGEAVMKLGGGNETRLIVLIMTLAGGLGAFMSSSAIVAMFIPLVLTVARKTSLNSKRMLMPLSVAALVSGMMTLIASSPNMIIESTLRGRGLAPLDFFSWTPFGLAVLAAADRVHVGGAEFAEQANYCEGRCGYLSERFRSRRLLWSHRSLASITSACRLAAHRSVRGADEAIIRRLECRSRGLREASPWQAAISACASGVSVRDRRRYFCRRRKRSNETTHRNSTTRRTAPSR